MFSCARDLRPKAKGPKDPATNLRFVSVSAGFSVVSFKSIAVTVLLMSSPILGVLVVGFHHQRGPEVEYVWPEIDGDRPAFWDILAFQALPDGSHLREEDYSYFTVITGREDCPTAFGIACNRQLKSAALKVRPEDVTRSTIQKAVVVLTRTPHVYAHIKDKLGAVTKAYFHQLNFEDREILRGFYDSLVHRLTGNLEEFALYTGMPVRELIRNFRHRVIVLVKALLLEKRILYFGTNIERLCTAQYSILSLIPGLLESLDYCGDPDLAKLEEGTNKVTHLRTSDRKSVLAYMGMPLHPFNKGGFFGPYTPLQQVDLLEDEGTKSYMIGTSNSLFLQTKERHCDILVDTDNNTIEILHPSLKSALALSLADRKWADSVCAIVDETWDEKNPEMPSTRTFAGSEEDIRGMFEKYIFSLCSLIRYDQYLHKKVNGIVASDGELDIECGIQLKDFGMQFIDSWKETENYRIWNRDADDEIFDIQEPRHPVIDRFLTVQDVQNRLAQGVADLRLEERTAPARAALKSTWLSGSSKVNKLWSDVEAYREERRRRLDDTGIQSDQVVCVITDKTAKQNGAHFFWISIYLLIHQIYCPLLLSSMHRRTIETI